MSYISQRIVKQKKYYYLEESFEYKNKLVKESVYFGSMYPSNDEIFLGYEVLKRTCLARNHIVIVPPLTEFIRNRTAKILENVKNTHLENLKKLNEKQLQKINNEKIQSLINFFLLIEKNKIEKINFEHLMKYYLESIQKNEALTEIKIRKMHSLIMGHLESKSEEYDSNLMHIFLTWYKEKTDLIHQVEFAAKFYAKFYNLKLFNENNPLLSFVLMNYILEQKGFPFIEISKKRINSFDKALESALKEDYKLITYFLVDEICKTKKEL